MNILFSNKPDWEDDIRAGFESTSHTIAFGDFTADNVREHDMLVALTVSDLRRLHELGDARGDKPIPIPSLDSIALCDDKLAFNRALVTNGFAECIPKMGLFLAYPYILKKRVDEWGANSCIIRTAAEVAAHADKLVDPDYFRQEYISGKTEYTAHILFSQGRIVCSTTVIFEFEHEIFIKGRDADCGRAVCECQHLELFGRILTSIRFEGLCCFNYKVLNGQPLIFEVNPRFGASLGLLYASFIENMELAETLLVETAN